MAGCILIKPGASGIDPDDLTALPGDVLKGKKAGVAGSDEPAEGTLELTGNIAAADIRKGKTGYSTNPKSKITGTMAEQAAQTITPGAANKTIAATRYLTGVQTILGDPNLVPKNIIRPVIIFGVKGSAVYAGDTPGYFLEPPKEYESLTGGWNIFDSNNDDRGGKLEKGSSYYRIYSDNNTNSVLFRSGSNLPNSEGGAFLTMIPMSNYRYLYLDYEYDITFLSNMPSTGEVYVHLRFNIDTSKTASSGSISGGNFTRLKISSNALNKNVHGSGTLKLDVSNVTTENKISVELNDNSLGGTNDEYKCRIKYDLKIKAIRYDKIG